MDKRIIRCAAAVAVAVMAVIFLVSCAVDSVPASSNDKQISIELVSPYQFPSGEIKLHLTNVESGKQYGLVFSRSNGYKKTVNMPEGKYTVDKLEFTDISTAGSLYREISDFSGNSVKITLKEVDLKSDQPNVLNVTFAVKSPTATDVAKNSIVIISLIIVASVALLVIWLKKRNLSKTGRRG